MNDAVKSDLGPCPKCGNRLGCHTPVNTDIKEVPVGAVVLCSYCGEVLRVTESRTLRIMTGEEHVEFIFRNPRLAAALDEASTKLRELRAAK